MQDPTDAIAQASPHEPWNKGKLIGAKPPLRPKHVWSIRTKLQIAGRTRDLAMFNLAIDSKLRACDVFSLKVEDVAPHGHAVARATVRQKKTGQPVRFEMTEQTREALDIYIGATSKKPGEFLFGGRHGRDRPITTRQYARLVCQWIAGIGLDPSFFGAHSLRRTKATLIYRPLATCGQYSFCWGTRRLRAPCAISALKSTTLSPLLSKLMSELPGQSGIALPLPQYPSRAISCRLWCFFTVDVRVSTGVDPTRT
jgi:Phage integrase family